MHLSMRRGKILFLTIWYIYVYLSAHLYAQPYKSSPTCSHVEAILLGSIALLNDVIFSSTTR